MIAVDPGSAVPPFEQVRAQLAAQIRAGELPPGERLPTVRRLAEDLGIAANTVARAYRELETEGLVATGGRNGTTVAWSADQGRRELEQAAARFAERVRALEIDPHAARALIDRALGLSD
jgi:DNA-binding transcriptional regulator YhcF (GntR family)